MEATFHIAAGHDLEVRSQKQGRVVDLSVITASGEDFDRKPSLSRRTYSLTPSEARALSSALMGAAAEA